MIPYLKPALIAMTVAGLTGGGWMSRGWFEDSKSLAAVEAQNALAAEIRQGQAQVSRQIESRLAELKANTRIIDRGIIREIEKPVYRNVCIPVDGDAFRLLNAAANGSAPAESHDALPANSTATD